MPLSNSRFAPVEEILHETLVRDPYRWLENRALPETDKWIREQQAICDAYFRTCNELPAIRERVREYLDIDVIDRPAKVGQRYFYRRRIRGQEQACIYVRDMGLDIERLLVDPSTHGPFVSVAVHRISQYGSLLAYELTQGGEDRQSIHIVDVEHGATLAGKVGYGYARGFTFTTDNQGFYYSHEFTPTASEHTVRHQFLNNSGEGHVVFRVVRSLGSRLVLTADSVHLGAFWTHESRGVLLGDFWLARRETPTQWHQVFANRKLPFKPVLQAGRLFAISYEQAPNGKVVELNCSGQETRTVIPDQGSMIRQLVITEDSVYLVVTEGPRSVVRSWELSGAEHPQITLPHQGEVHLLPSLGDGSSLFISSESFTRPQSICEFVPATRELSVWSGRILPCSMKEIVVEHTVYPSTDKQSIPITLVRDAASCTGMSHPVIMTGYGGFGISMVSQFSVLVTILLECGGVFAVPHIRGGGEFGRAWHEAGRGRNRQTSFNDFIAAAEWLMREGFTTPQQLAIFGSSHGGLLVGAAMMQRPNLFRAVLCMSALLDMVRYEQFDRAARWKREYGTAQIKEDFQALCAISPYHWAMDSKNFPAVLFVSGDKDDRCNPAHTRKMAARLAENWIGANPVLVDYSSERGHSPVLPLQIRIDALARRIAFLCRELNLSFSIGARRDTVCH
jgi:prolyl oligopeptidase